MPIDTWNSKTEEILSEQKQKCIGYKWMHEEETEKYSTRNKWFNIVSIIVVSATATSTSITGTAEVNNIGDMYISITRIIYPIILYLTAILNSLQHFLNYEKLAEQHRTSSLRYNLLYNNINRMLALEPQQRQLVNDYFTWCNKEYDNLFQSSPDISKNTVDLFNKEFKTSLVNHVKLNCNNKNDCTDTVVIMDNVNTNTNTTINTLETERIKYDLDRFMVNSYS